MRLGLSLLLAVLVLVAPAAEAKKDDPQAERGVHKPVGHERHQNAPESAPESGSTTRHEKQTKEHALHGDAPRDHKEEAKPRPGPVPLDAAPIETAPAPVEAAPVAPVDVMPSDVSTETIEPDAPAPAAEAAVAMDPVPAVASFSGGGPLDPTPSPTIEPPVTRGNGWFHGLLNATKSAAEETAGASAPVQAIGLSPWMLLVFGVTAGASTTLIGLRRVLRRSESVASPTQKDAKGGGLSQLVRRVTQAPMDALACFQLGLELLRLGIEQDGLRILDRALRINPLLVVQLLQEPEYASLRDKPGVQRLLAAIKRDYDRRLLTGYA